MIAFCVVIPSDAVLFCFVSANVFCLVCFIIFIKPFIVQD